MAAPPASTTATRHPHEAHARPSTQAPAVPGGIDEIPVEEQLGAIVEAVAGKAIAAGSPAGGGDDGGSDGTGDGPAGGGAPAATAGGAAGGGAAGGGAAASGAGSNGRQVGSAVRPAHLVGLQRAAGNRAVADRIGRASPRSGVVQRAPQGTVKEASTDEVTVTAPIAEKVPIIVDAGGLDEAAKLLAGWLKPFLRGSAVIVGLHPTFILVYDQNGSRISDRIPIELRKGMGFIPGVYGAGRRDQNVKQMYWDENGEPVAGDGDAVVVVEPRKGPPPGAPGAAEAPASGGAAPAPASTPTLNLREFMKNASQLDALATRYPTAVSLYLVPRYTSGGGKAGGTGARTSGFAGELSGGGTGPAPNMPPWPVSVDGPKMQPVDSTGTFVAKIDWAANGNGSIANQVISQIGTSIHYRWEVFDVTSYAKKQEQELAAQAAQTQAMVRALNTPASAPAGGPGLAVRDDPTAMAGGAAAEGAAVPSGSGEYDAKLDELAKSRAGTGTRVTGGEAADKAFADDFGNLWKDTKRAKADLRGLRGDTTGEVLSNVQANLTALSLLPASAIVTGVGASLRWASELFAGPKQQMEIPWAREGTFLVRVISTPRVSEDPQGNPVIRPSSVASAVVKVVKTERMVREALDAPGAELAEAETELAKARKANDQARIDELTKVVELKRLEASGDPGALLRKKIELKEAELVETRRKWGTTVRGPVLRIESELETLRNRLKVFELQERRRTAGDATLGPPARLSATLISEVTGQSYPLLLSAGPMAMDGTRHHWKVLDATSQDSEGFEGYGATPSAALRSALDKFGALASFGRGTIGVRVPKDAGLEPGAPAEFRIESAPAGWAIARSRIDDLVMTLAAIGLFVASAGTASAVIGAAVAAARLIDRLHNGTLRMDAALVSDALAILGGAGTAAQVAAGFRVQKLGKAFVMLEEGGATSDQLRKAATLLDRAADLAKAVEAANEVLNYAGVLWGNVVFLDDMMRIAGMEASGEITHAEARRQRAMAIGGAVNNNGMFIAANAIKAREARKAAAKKAAAAEAGRGEGAGTTKPGDTAAPGGEATSAKPGGEGPAGARHEGAGRVAPHEGPPATGAGADATPAAGGLVGETRAGTTGGGTEAGPAPKPPTPKEQRAAAQKAFDEAARGSGNLAQSAERVIGSDTWKEGLKKLVGKLEGEQRAAAEKALVEAREKLVNETWQEIARDYPDLMLENAGTKSFGSDIDATVRPRQEAATPGDQMAGQVKRAAEAAQKLSDALRAKVGGETDALIDTNIYSYIGEGAGTKPTDPTGRSARQHVDLVVGLAEQMRGVGEAEFRAFEQRLAKKLSDPSVAPEAKALLAEARKFHDARKAEWADARAKAKQAMKGEPEAAVDRAAREALLGQKKSELAGLLASPTPDPAQVTAKQAEINWFAPDAYATPSAFQQAVAHGQRLKGTARTAGELSGHEVAAKLRAAAKDLPPDSPRAQKLARDAARVESQQRLLDMTLRELASEQAREPMDGARVKDLEGRAKGIREAIAKTAEPVVVAEILGATAPAERAGPERLSEAAAASGANQGMLESHVSHAKDIDGKVKAACKYAGRIAMAEFLSGLKPASDAIAQLLGEFVQSRWGIFEDVSPQLMRDMFLRYAELKGRGNDVVRNARGEPVGVSDALKQAFVDEVRGWARGTNEHIQTSAIAAKAFDNPSVPVAGKPGGSESAPGPATKEPGPAATGGDAGATTTKSAGTRPGGETATPTVEGGPGGERTPPGGEQEGAAGSRAGGPEVVPRSGAPIAAGKTPVLSPPGADQPFAFRLGSLKEGHAALRALARGDASVLAANGVQVPPGYESHGVEFGLARFPDGTYGIVQGTAGSVGWTNLPPGTVAVAHTHPMLPGRELSRPGTVTQIAERIGKATDDGPSPEARDRVHVFPSAADLRFVAANGIPNHDVHSPYVHTGDGVLKTPTGAPNELPVSFNIADARHSGNIGANPVIDAAIVAHDSQGNVLFIGRMWAVEVVGESVISFEPIRGLEPPDPSTLAKARTAGPDTAPDGVGRGGGTSSKAGTGRPGDEIAGGVKVTDDGIATWVKANRNPAALVRIQTDGDTLTVTDIYRRDLAEGSGVLLLAEGLLAVKAQPGTEIVIGEVLNPETKAAHDRGDPPATSRLGKTAERALNRIGLSVVRMEWQLNRGKLTIVVTVG